MSYRKKGGRDPGRGSAKNLDHLAPGTGARRDRRAQPGGLGMQKTSSRKFESSKDLRDDVLSHDTSLDRHSSGKAIGGLGMSKISPRRGKENLRDNRAGQDKRSKFAHDRNRGHKDNDLDLRSDSKRSIRGHRDTDRYGGRKSPEFGHHTSDDRLETFGDREAVHKRTQAIRKDSRAKALDIPRSEVGDDRTRSKYGNRLDDKRNVRTSGGRPPTGSRTRADDRRRSTSKPGSERGIPRGGASTRGRGIGSEKGSRVSRGATSSYDDPRYERHMSSKSAKKGAKTLNFTEDKRKREKNWLLDFNSYRPILHLPDKMEQPEKDTVSYLIKLDGVNNIPTDNIPVLKQKGVTPNLIYSCTLYDEKERCFIGRSYNSRPIQLKPTFNATDPTKKEFIFMHTSLKELTLCLVVEVYLEIVELNNKNKTQYVSLGFSIFHLFDEKGVARVANIPMYLGTPRFLVCAAPFKDMQIHPSTLAIQIKEYPIWNNLKKLVPSTTLCGMNDLIPGIVGNKMSLKNNGHQLSGKEDVVCSDIQIITSRNFEETFLKFLEEFIFEKYKADDELLPKATCLRIGYPRIRERKMIINYDNTWRTCGNQVFIALEPPTADTYKALGFVEIKDFILDPNVALIFKIEFRLDMPTKEPKKYEIAFFTIAWGYYLPNFTENGEMLSGPVNCALRLGPGTAPDGSVLWTPDEKHQENYKLEMSAELTSRGTFDPDSIRPKSIRNTPKVRVDHLDPNPSKRFDFEDEVLSGTQSRPVNDAESERAKKRLETEQKINRQQEREKAALKKQVESLRGQLLDKNSGLVAPQFDLDVKDIQKDERRNYEIMQQKFDSKIKEMRDYYEDQMYKQTTEAKSPERFPGSPGISRHQRVPSGPAHQLPYASSYLADPSMYHPSFYPPDDRSRLIGQSRYIDEDLKILPPPPQVPIELPTTFDLTRDDEIAFVKLGIKDEILKHDSLDQPDLEIEMRNELQASEFTFRFIAFKPPLTMPFGQSVPRRMYFKFNFFTFSESTTEACSLKDPDGTTDMVRELRPGQQYLLERIGKVRISEVRPVEVDFQIDKTVSKVYDENVMFYKYLLQRELSIDIFDADSHLHYGTCRVNLRSMLKQTRPGVVRARNCEIAAFEASNRSITGAVNMGHLQILMSHQGKKESEVNNLDREKAIDDNNFLEERKQPSQKHKFNKKVKSKPVRALYEEYVSNKPDDLYEKVIEDPYHIDEEESEEIRKKMRVERLKKFKFKQKVLTDYERSLKNAHRPEEVLNIIDDPSKPEWLKNQSLKQIETLRDYTKPYVIENVLKEHIKSMKQLYIVPGTPSFFKYNLKNPFSSRTVFTINIIDPDKIYLGEVKEFRLVNNNNFEWEFWHSKRKWDAPKYWDMINKNDEIMLEPGEECPLLFKYNTFREYSPHKNGSELNIKERAIHIIFEYSSHREGKGQIFETRLVVTPRKPPIDFSITFSEPPNSHASITIPASFYADPFQSFCSDQNVLCEFDAENRLTAELRTPDVEYNNPKSFLVYIYRDKFWSGLQCVLRIVIESIFCVYTKSRVGLRIEQSLTMQGDKPRKVLLYSDNNRMVETSGEVFNILPDTHNVLNVSIKSFERDYKKVKINCVDANTRELLKSWLMLVESEEPKITRSENIQLYIDRGVTRELEFENKLNKEAIFEFATNRPDLCRPSQSHIRVGPKMNKRIEFYFPPKRVKGKGDCLIFINDEEYNFYEVYRFKLAYVA